METFNEGIFKAMIYHDRPAAEKLIAGFIEKNPTHWKELLESFGWSVKIIPQKTSTKVMVKRRTRYGRGLKPLVIKLKEGS